MKPIGSRLSKACSCCNHSKATRGREVNDARKSVAKELLSFDEVPRTGRPENYDCDCCGVYSYLVLHDAFVGVDADGDEVWFANYSAIRAAGQGVA